MNGRFAGHKDRGGWEGEGPSGAARALGRGQAAERINQLAEQFYEVQEEQKVQ